MIAVIVLFTWPKSNQVELKQTKEISSVDVESQFLKPYPKDDIDNHSVHSQSVSEMTKRLMLLKKMDRESSHLDKKQIKKLHQYYFQLAQAPNEAWPVRVQAFRNLRNMKSFTKWSEREKILQQVDKRILHLSQYSDQELLEKVVEHGQGN